MNNEEKIDLTDRELLFQKADLLGIAYPKNISTAKLVDLISKSNGSAKEESVDKAEMSESEARLARQLELTKKVRVTISCNDPAMREYEMTPYYSLSNSEITLPTITIPLNVEWHIPNGYVDMLKDMECGISVKSKDAQGRKITVRKMIKKYNVTVLPPLTAKELDELKQAQIMRDGIK